MSKRPATPEASHVAEEARASAEKRRRTEAKRLDYSNPGEKQSTVRPELMETGVRTTRSGKKIPVMTAEEIEHEDVFQVRDGSLAERTLDIARQLKNQVAGEEDGDDKGGRGDGGRYLHDLQHASWGGGRVFLGHQMLQVWIMGCGLDNGLRAAGWS